MASMAGTGQSQSLNDRLNAARFALAGQGLARVVCKATTEEIIGPKKKHLDYLLQCTHEPNVSVPQLANLLIERTGHQSWVVVFKALVTVQHLMCYGNERFTQYLASSNCNFQLSNFLDKQGVKGYDMSTFIRRYAKYINEKALAYRTVAFDFCKIKRGKEEGSLRTMPADRLLKTIPTLQSQIDALLEFDCTANDLCNGVINAAFMLLFRDLIRLFACYNDAIINLLEKFFEMNRRQAREALDIYKRFLIRMDRVAEFLKVAENVGIDKGEIPDLTRAPSSLLEALEQHLVSLEGGKPGKGKSKSHNTAEQPAAAAANNNGSADVRKALEEEAAAMNKLKFQLDSNVVDSKRRSSSSTIAAWQQEDWPSLVSVSLPASEKHSTEKAFNPFLDSPTEAAAVTPVIGEPAKSPKNEILQLFDEAAAHVAPPVPPPPAVAAVPSSSNPFADIMGALSTAAVPPAVSPSSQGFDAFGDILQPQKPGAAVNTTGGVGGGAPPVPPPPAGPVITGDLDSSLASLAQNLDINGPAKGGSYKKGQNQFATPKSQPMNAAMTGGLNWEPQWGNATSQTGQMRFQMPMAASMPTSVSAGTLNGGGGLIVGGGNNNNGFVGLSPQPPNAFGNVFASSSSSTSNINSSSSLNSSASMPTGFSNDPFGL